MLTNTIPAENKSVAHRAQLGIECPQCHWRQFVEIHLEQPVVNSPMAFEIRRHLEAWMASHCPDHLNAISKLSRN